MTLHITQWMTEVYTLMIFVQSNKSEHSEDVIGVAGRIIDNYCVGDKRLLITDKVDMVHAWCKGRA